MELKKENIHRIDGKAEGMSCGGRATFSLDDDFNVPDSKPDVRLIIRETGRIRITEKKCVGGRLHVKGALVTDILYIGDDGSGVYGMEGELAFDEMIHMDREDCQNVTLRAEAEDVTATMIHSRKINVKARIEVKAVCEEMKDEIVVTETAGSDLVARAKDVSFTNLAAVKKDTVRIREEVKLPPSRQNIGEMIYREVHLVMPESRVLDGEISVKGNAELFLVYRGNGLRENVEFYETTVPFTGSFELSGARPDMIEDISFTVLQESINTKPDEDGEERMIELEAVLEVDIKLYEEKELTVLEDIYSLSGKVKLSGEEEQIPRLLMKNQGMGSFFGTYRMPELSAVPLQISYGNSEVHLEKITRETDGLVLEGMLGFKVLFVTGSDERPYLGLRFYEPFTQRLEVKGINDACTYKVVPVVTGSSFQLYRSNELEWKTEVNFQSMVFLNEPEYMITDAEFVPFTEEEAEKMYGVLGYRSEPGDTLWSVGKQFHIAPDAVAELNGLTEEEIPDKKMLLLVRNSISEEIIN